MENRARLPRLQRGFPCEVEEEEESLVLAFPFSLLCGSCLLSLSRVAAKRRVVGEGSG